MTRVAGAGPFARMSCRKIFGSSLLRGGCLVTPSAGGRPALSRLNMSLATAVIPWLVHRNCRDHIRGVDIVGVGVVGINRNRFAVMFGVTSQVDRYFEASPGGRGLGAGAGQRIECLD